MHNRPTTIKAIRRYSNRFASDMFSAPGRGIVAAKADTLEVMPMSALGQKQTFAAQKVMSALPPKGDMCGALGHVCFGPKADIKSLGAKPALLCGVRCDLADSRGFSSIDINSLLRIRLLARVFEVSDPPAHFREDT